MLKQAFQTGWKQIISHSVCDMFVEVAEIMPLEI
jgi:hypothetical protein